jgi:hypothetical protein
MFGHYYRGKGFGHIDRIRALLPDEIELRVAGRGTERIPPSAGVTVDGPVDGTAMTDWFAGVRLILLPYRRSRIGGIQPFASSATLGLAAAHDTPSIALTSPVMTELTGAGGGEVVADIETMVARTAELVHDDSALRLLAGKLASFRTTYGGTSAVDSMLQLWSDP